jgi:hypothetical protein
VTDRGTIGVVAALGAGQPLDVGVQQAPQYPQTGPDREREQASRAAPASSASAIVTRSGRTNSASAGTVGCVCLGMWRSLLVEQLGRCPTPTTRQASGGDRHLKFYEVRDNLAGVNDHNHRATALYLRLGYQETGCHYLDRYHYIDDNGMRHEVEDPARFLVKPPYEGHTLLPAVPSACP